MRCSTAGVHPYEHHQTHVRGQAWVRRLVVVAAVIVVVVVVVLWCGGVVWCVCVLCVVCCVLFTCSLPFNACGQMTKSVPDAPHPVRTKHAGPRSSTQHVHTGQLPALGVGRAVAFCHTLPENTSCSQRPLKNTFYWRETESYIPDSPLQHRKSTARMPHLQEVGHSRLVLLRDRIRPARARVALAGRWSPLSSSVPLSYCFSGAPSSPRHFQECRPLPGPGPANATPS